MVQIAQPLIFRTLATCVLRLCFVVYPMFYSVLYDRAIGAMIVMDEDERDKG